jgi:hypothetical protein
VIVGTCAGLLLASACGGTDPAPDAAGTEPSVELVASGFGQDGEYVQGIVVVTTDSAASVGEFVTASVNFLDAAGGILATEDQVESFSWVGQQLVLPVWLDLSDDPTADAASIDVSLSISDHGPTDPRPELPVLESTGVTANEYGGFTASFLLTNGTAGDLTDPRVGVVCYDSGGTIIGGTSLFPELVAAGKTVRIDPRVVVSGEPTTCKAFPNYGL